MIIKESEQFPHISNVSKFAIFRDHISTFLSDLKHTNVFNYIRGPIYGNVIPKLLGISCTGV